jgi:hypothetical protein
MASYYKVHLKKEGQLISCPFDAFLYIEIYSSIVVFDEVSSPRVNLTLLFLSE